MNIQHSTFNIQHRTLALVLALVCCTLALSCVAAPTNNPVAATRSVTVNTNGALAGADTNFFRANTNLWFPLLPPGSGSGTNGGLNGTNGVNGVNGTNGVNGINGTNGINGINGTNGVNGTNGATGPQGPAGANGAGTSYVFGQSTNAPGVITVVGTNVFSGTNLLADAAYQQFVNYVDATYIRQGASVLFSNVTFTGSVSGIPWSALSSGVPDLVTNYQPSLFLGFGTNGQVEISTSSSGHPVIIMRDAASNETFRVNGDLGDLFYSGTISGSGAGLSGVILADQTYARVGNSFQVHSDDGLPYSEIILSVDDGGGTVGTNRIRTGATGSFSFLNQAGSGFVDIRAKTSYATNFVGGGEGLSNLITAAVNSTTNLTYSLIGRHDIYTTTNQYPHIWVTINGNVGTFQLDNKSGSNITLHVTPPAGMSLWYYPGRSNNVMTNLASAWWTGAGTNFPNPLLQGAIIQ